MAAGMESPVKSCRFLLIIFLTLNLLCQISLISGSTTTTPSITTQTTESTSTEAQTSTEAPTTTQVQTTTTTPPVVTLPPTTFQSNTDIGQCPCDLTGNACDVNCVCDPDCTSDDIAAFSEVLPESVQKDKRLCLQSDVILSDNSPLTTTYDQGGLFCIYYDNNDERNFYNIPDFVADLQTFNDYRNRYAGPTFSPGSTPTTMFTQFYRYGDPVYVVYETLATGFLRQPKALASSQCSDDNPVAYLKDESFGCQRTISTFTLNACQNSEYLKASTYYQGFKVVSTPFLFSYIVNGTVVTTPAPTTTPLRPTTPAPTPAPTTTNDTNSTATTETSTTVTTSTSTATVATTTTVSPDNVTNTTEPDTTVVMTTEADLSSINLFNNSYTVEVQLLSLECRDINNNLRDCGFTVPPDPTFAGTTCSNAVSGVEYVLTHRGTTGIVQGGVRLVLRDYNDAALPLTQTFTSSFQSENGDRNITERSGNPGYVIGKPVRAGVLPTTGNGTAGNRYAIIESLYDLTLVKSSATGTCATDAANRIQVNFGENTRTGCLISFNLDTANVTEYCNLMQQTVINALEGMNNTDIRDNPNNLRRVATFGNSDVLQTGDWVQIIREGFPTLPVASSDPLTGPTCRLVMGMHVEILYANVGALANPQAKIVGVAFKYEDPQDVTYTCGGSYCTPGNTNLDQFFEVSQSVSFIDVSQEATAYVGDPPIFIAKVPYDFFYPFAGSADSIKHNSMWTVSLVLLVGIILNNMLFS